MVDYSSESIYNGGDSFLNSEFSNYTGFNRLAGSQIGFPGSPSTGNQLGETVNAIKSGTKVFEVTMLGPPTGNADQAMPKQHFHEIRALMKLTGVKPSLHGPLMDAAGFSSGQSPGWGGEQERENNERRMFEAIEKVEKTNNTLNVYFKEKEAPELVERVEPGRYLACLLYPALSDGE